MGKRANPLLVGSFVLGGLALAVTVIATIGSGKFFRHTQRFVAYFDGSVNGLDKGAPVKFRGVPIGTVTDVRLKLPPQQVEDRRIPVLIEIDEDRLRELGETRAVSSDQQLVADLIAQGLRAQLELQSLIAGVLYVGLEVVEGSPARFALPPGSGYREIPSLPTTLEQAQTKLSEVLTQLSKLDVDGIGRSVTAAADGVTRLASSPDLQSAIVTLREALGAVRDVAGSVDARIGPLAANVNGRVDDARDSLKRLDGALDNVTALTDPRAPLADGLGAAITEVTGAARAVRQLADELSRNPNIILTGRGGSR